MGSMMLKRIHTPFVGRSLVAAVVLAAAVLSGWASLQTGNAAAQTAKATTPPVQPPRLGLMGTLTSASGNTLKITLMQTHRSATVILTSKTTYIVNGKLTKSHPAWKKGEPIQFVGPKSKSGSYTATSVTVGMPAGGPGGPPPGGLPPVSGSVVSAASSTLVVKTSTGKTTYKLMSTTRYLVNGKAVTKRPAFKAGEQVHVMASKSGSTLIAQMVIIGAMPAPPSGGPPGTSG